MTGKKALAQGGFTLLGMLFLIAGLGVGLAAVGIMWSTAVKRDKEQELLFVGNEYRKAIESFWEIPLPVGTQRRLPRNFNELLLDPRFPQTVRHLRRLYRDPVTGASEWGMVREPDGGLAGVYSLSQDEPAKKAGFESRYSAFDGKQHYSDWVFAFKPANPQGEGQPQSPSAQKIKK